MNRKHLKELTTKYNNMIPPPDQLAQREDNVKVTIALKKSSVDFFKKQAKKHKTSYQKMMREVIDLYASHYA